MARFLLVAIGTFFPLATSAQSFSREDRLGIFFLIYGLGFLVTLLILVAISQKKPQKDSPARIISDKNA